MSDKKIKQASVIVKKIISLELGKYENIEIKGNLDLSHLSIDIPIKFDNCYFNDEVLFLYTEFRHSVEFINCTFNQIVNCGDELHSHTIFRKDFVLLNSILYQNFSFVGTTCEGSVVFNKSKFLSTNTLINFTNSVFKKSLECESVIFNGNVTFNSIDAKIGASFNLTKFENKESNIDFTASNFGRVLQCQSSKFNGGANFNGINCGLWTNFSPLILFSIEKQKLIDFINEKNYGSIKIIFNDNNIELSNELNLIEKSEDYSWELTDTLNHIHYYIIIDGDSLNITQPTIFNGTDNFLSFEYSALGNTLNFQNAFFYCQLVNFSALKCRDFYLTGSEFKNEEGSCTFIHSVVENKLDISDSIFLNKDIDFSNIHCKDFWLTNSIFDNENSVIDFRHSKIDWILNCNEAIFNGIPNFNGANYKGGAFFQKAKFNNEGHVDFGFSKYGLNLQFEDASFKGSVSIESAEVSELLHLQNTSISNEFSLKNAKINRLIFDTQLETDASFDFTGFRFNSIDESNSNLFNTFATKQTKYKFSRDPFIQLEQYYEKTGNTVEAKNVYYQGRKIVRKWAFDKDSNIHWPLTRKIGDWILQITSGYGTKNTRILTLIVLTVGLGVVVFWNKNQIMPANFQCENIYSKLIYKILYSIDLFIPVVNFNISDNYKPDSFLLQTYSFFHIMMGWLFVPLAIASFSGFIRNSKKWN